MTSVVIVATVLSVLPALGAVTTIQTPRLSSESGIQPRTTRAVLRKASVALTAHPLAATTAAPANPIDGYIQTSGTTIFDQAGTRCGSSASIPPPC